MLDILFNSKKKRNFEYVIIGINIILSIVGLFILPDQIGIQINSAGEFTNIVSKYIGLAIGPGASILISIVGNRDKNLDRTFRNILLELLMLGVTIFIFIVNLR